MVPWALKVLAIGFILCQLIIAGCQGQLIRKDKMDLGVYNSETKKYEKKIQQILGGDDHDYKDHSKQMFGGDDHDYKDHSKQILGGDDHDYNVHNKQILGGDDHDYKEHNKIILGGDDHDYKEHTKQLLGGDDHDYNEHTKQILGGDDHDYKEHNKIILGGDDHDYKEHTKQLLGGDDHDYNEHTKQILGGDDHDYKEHNKIILGGDDHDYKEHTKQLLGGDDHDYKEHTKKILGGDDHDYKDHSKQLFGGDDHDYKEHTKQILGGDDHDYKEHTKQLFGGDDHDYKEHTKQILGGDDHDYKDHTKIILGGDDHDYKPHNQVLFGTGDHDYKNHGKSFNAFKDHKISHVALFNKFVKDHKKTFKSYKDFQRRLSIFRSNMKKAKTMQLNEKGTAQYGVTKFADLTRLEFSQLLGLKPSLKPKKSSMQAGRIPNVDTPVEFDWRSKGVVTEVKNQGMCGSCWAFSVTGNVEGQWAIKHKQLFSLSEQELVDCDDTDQGCSGGMPENAYKAIEELGGLETETGYPYEGIDDKCQLDSTKMKVKVNGSVELPEDEEKMKNWLFANGPISIGINANALQFYMGGVSHPFKFLCNPADLDHGMLIVGYGIHTTKYLHRRQPYWLVKNSWGADWGEKGYYRVYRGDGTCGVNKMATSAIVP